MTEPPDDLPPRSVEWQERPDGWLVDTSTSVGIAILPGPAQDRIAREVDWYAARRRAAEPSMPVQRRLL